jgi:hypothetical protein
LDPVGARLHASPGTRPTAPTQGLENEIHRLEQLRDIFKSSPRRTEIDGIIATRRKQLAEAAKGPRTFSEAELAAIRASLVPAATAIDPAVPADLHQKLADFRRLVDQGVQLTDAEMKDLEPADAFVRLVRVPWHAENEQIRFKTYQDHAIVLTTLRPEYLHSLSYYADKTRDGVVFYEKKNDEFARIDSPHEFIMRYADKPESALVKALDGAFVPLEDAKRRELELTKKLMVINQVPGQGENPKVEDLGDTISIGGIVVKKRR